MNSQGMAAFRNHLFSRIVPIVKDIGLWGIKVTRACEDMGVIAYASVDVDVDVDVDAMQADDEQIARDYDARTAHVEDVIAKGRDPVVTK